MKTRSKSVIMLRTILLLTVVGSCFAASHHVSENARITNGVIAGAGDVPYIVSVRIRGEHVCGGAILDATHVVTGAQCVESMPPAILSIQYGVLLLSPAENVVSVSGSVLYPGFNYSGIDDIAVLTLASAMRLDGTNVKAVTLPTAGSETPGGTVAVLAGWGSETLEGDILPELKKIDVLVYADASCLAANDEAQIDYNICVGIPSEGKGHCKGDNGGPVTINGNTLVGIISWAKVPCGQIGHPDICTKVSKYVVWLHAQTKL